MEKILQIIATPGIEAIIKNLSANAGGEISLECDSIKFKLVIYAKVGN